MDKYPNIDGSGLENQMTRVGNYIQDPDGFTRLFSTMRYAPADGDFITREQVPGGPDFWEKLLLFSIRWRSILRNAIFVPISAIYGFRSPAFQDLS